jgi:hypothetical protein
MVPGTIDSPPAIILKRGTSGWGNVRWTTRLDGTEELERIISQIENDAQLKIDKSHFVGSAIDDDKTRVNCFLFVPQISSVRHVMRGELENFRSFTFVGAHKEPLSDIELDLMVKAIDEFFSITN